VRDHPETVCRPLFVLEIVWEEAGRMHQIEISYGVWGFAHRSRQPGQMERLIPVLSKSVGNLGGFLTTGGYRAS
jgi:hypothetical protein